MCTCESTIRYHHHLVLSQEKPWVCKVIILSCWSTILTSIALFFVLCLNVCLPIGRLAVQFLASLVQTSVSLSHWNTHWPWRVPLCVNVCDKEQKHCVSFNIVKTKMYLSLHNTILHVSILTMYLALINVKIRVTYSLLLYMNTSCVEMGSSCITPV